MSEAGRTEIEATAVLIPWYKEINSMQWRNLIASWLGWVLDAMDMMFFACVLLGIMKDWGVTTGSMGLVAALALVGSALGGTIFGLVSDYWGRTKALMSTVLIYSVFSGLSGLSQNILQLLVFRFCVGLGMGGEWGAGAALVAETWPAKHRGKGIGLMHTGWAVGYMLAAVVAGILIPVWGWRGVFFVGVIPALLVFWVRKAIKEPEIWSKMTAQRKRGVEPKSTGFKFWQIWHRDVRGTTILLTVWSCFSMFAYWGLFTWLPGFLALPAEKGGAGLSILRTTMWLVVIQSGGLAGCFCFGFISDKIGRRKAFMIYLILAAAIVPIFALFARTGLLLFLGFAVGFFGWGYAGGAGALFSELFPTRVRATATGFSFNFGRGVGALAPFTIGVLAQTYGMGVSLTLTSIFYLTAGLLFLLLPETVGKELD